MDSPAVWSQLPAFQAVTDASVEQVNGAGGHGEYWSPDLAPVSPSAREWGLVDIAALWVALSARIPTYMLASFVVYLALTLPSTRRR